MQEIKLPLQSVRRMVSLDITDSTQNVAKELAASGCEANTLVLAYEQTGGRGQFERTWSAPRGGVYFSLVLRPNKLAQHSGNLSLKTAQAVSDALTRAFGLKTKIKHPNDVLAWDAKTKKWKKICGILIETSTGEERTDWLAVGIGVNVNNPIPRALKDIAVNLRQLTGAEIDPEEVLEEVLNSFWQHYGQWELSNQIAA